MIPVLGLTYLLRHLWFQPSVCISFSSQHYAAKIYLDFFLSSPSCDLKKVTDSRLWFPFSRVVGNLAEIIEEILAEIQKSKPQSAGFDSLKTWAGTAKGNKSDSLFQIK